MICLPEGKHQGPGQQWAQSDAESMAAGPDAASGGPQQNCSCKGYTHQEPVGLRDRTENPG